MNIIIKKFSLVLSLCTAPIYALEEQSGEHKSSESRLILNTYADFCGVESMESLGTVDPEDLNGDDCVEKLRLHEGYLTAEERADLKAIAVKEPFVVFGADPFPDARTATQKGSCLQWLSRLCCCRIAKTKD